MNHGANLVERTITLGAPADEARLARLRAADGVVLVCRLSDASLEVTYDLDRMNLAKLESLMADAGLPLASGFFARLARRWAAFQEDNQRAHSKIVHQCCSNPPSRD
jgi:hypothetical protein